MSPASTPLASLATASRGAVAVVHQTADLLDSLAARLKAARTCAGLSQHALADRSGASRSVIAQIEIGCTHNPSMITMVKLGRALGMDPRELMPEEPPLAAAARNALIVDGIVNHGGRRLTDEEAQNEWDNAPTVPMSEDRIKEIVEFATTYEGVAAGDSSDEDGPPADAFSPKAAVKVAADSIGELRGIDVYRVISSTEEDDRPELLAYIRENRPDLSPAIDEALIELRDERRPLPGGKPATKTKPTPANGKQKPRRKQTR